MNERSEKSDLIVIKDHSFFSSYSRCISQLASAQRLNYLYSVQNLVISVDCSSSNNAYYSYIKQCVKYILTAISSAIDEIYLDSKVIIHYNVSVYAATAVGPAVLIDSALLTASTLNSVIDNTNKRLNLLQNQEAVHQSMAEQRRKNVNFTEILDYSLMALDKLPIQGLSSIILLTDCVLNIDGQNNTSLYQFNSFLSQLRQRDIQVSILQLSQLHSSLNINKLLNSFNHFTLIPHYSFGYFPHSELLQFIAKQSQGFFYSAQQLYQLLQSNQSNSINQGLSEFQRALLLRQGNISVNPPLNQSVQTVLRLSNNPINLSPNNLYILPSKVSINVNNVAMSNARSTVYRDRLLHYQLNSNNSNFIHRIIETRNNQRFYCNYLTQIHHDYPILQALLQWKDNIYIEYLAIVAAQSVSIYLNVLSDYQFVHSYHKYCQHKAAMKSLKLAQGVKLSCNLLNKYIKGIQASDLLLNSINKINFTVAEQQFIQAKINFIKQNGQNPEQIMKKPAELAVESYLSNKNLLWTYLANHNNSSIYQLYSFSLISTNHLNQLVINQQLQLESQLISSSLSGSVISLLSQLFLVWSHLNFENHFFIHIIDRESFITAKLQWSNQYNCKVHLQFYSTQHNEMQATVQLLHNLINQYLIPLTATQTIQPFITVEKSLSSLINQGHDLSQNILLKNLNRYNEWRWLVDSTHLSTVLSCIQLLNNMRIAEGYKLFHSNDNSTAYLRFVPLQQTDNHNKKVSSYALLLYIINYQASASILTTQLFIERCVGAYSYTTAQGLRSYVYTENLFQAVAQYLHAIDLHLLSSILTFDTIKTLHANQYLDGLNLNFSLADFHSNPNFTCLHDHQARSNINDSIHFNPTIAHSTDKQQGNEENEEIAARIPNTSQLSPPHAISIPLSLIYLLNISKAHSTNLLTPHIDSNSSFSQLNHNRLLSMLITSVRSFASIELIEKRVFAELMNEFTIVIIILPGFINEAETNPFSRYLDDLLLGNLAEYNENNKKQQQQDMSAASLFCSIYECNRESLISSQLLHREKVIQHNKNNEKYSHLIKQLINEFAVPIAPNTALPNLDKIIQFVNQANNLSVANSISTEDENNELLTGNPTEFERFQAEALALPDINISPLPAHEEELNYSYSIIAQLQSNHMKNFVCSVYLLLTENFAVQLNDFSTAVKLCSEVSNEIPISYLQSVSEADSFAAPQQIRLNLQGKFEELVEKNFKLIPFTQYFYYKPEDSAILNEIPFFLQLQGKVLHDNTLLAASNITHHNRLFHIVSSIIHSNNIKLPPDEELQTVLSLNCLSLHSNHGDYSILPLSVDLIMKSFTARLTSLIAEAMLNLLLYNPNINYSSILSVERHLNQLIQPELASFTQFCVPLHFVESSKVFLPIFIQELLINESLQLGRINLTGDEVYYSIHFTPISLPSKSSHGPFQYEFNSQEIVTQRKEDKAREVEHSRLWLLCRLNSNSVEVKLYSLNSDLAHLEQQIICCIELVNHRTNAKCLLNSLNSTRVASEVLIASPADELTSNSTNHVVFASGYYSCPLMESLIFPLHERLPIKIAIANLGPQALYPFTVSNRENVFVYQEKSGNVFYITLIEYDTNNPAAAANLSSHPNIAATGPAIIMDIYGLNIPGEEITVHLYQLLNSKLSTFTLQLISQLLSRNPLFKLTAADHNFIRPINSLANKTFLLPLAILPQYDSSSLMDRIHYSQQCKSFELHDAYLFLIYFKQNMEKLFTNLCLNFAVEKERKSEKDKSKESLEQLNGNNSADQFSAELRSTDLYFLYNNYSNPNPIYSKHNDYGKGLSVIYCSILDKATQGPIKSFPTHIYQPQAAQPNLNQHLQTLSSLIEPNDSDLVSSSAEKNSISSAEEVKSNDMDYNVGASNILHDSSRCVIQPIALDSIPGGISSAQQIDKATEGNHKFNLLNHLGLSSSAKLSSADDSSEAGYWLAVELWSLGSVNYDLLINRIKIIFNQTLYEYLIEILFYQQTQLNAQRTQQSVQLYNSTIFKLLTQSMQLSNPVANRIVYTMKNKLLSLPQLLTHCKQLLQQLNPQLDIHLLKSLSTQPDSCNYQLFSSLKKEQIQPHADRNEYLLTAGVLLVADQAQWHFSESSYLYHNHYKLSLGNEITESSTLSPGAAELKKTLHRHSNIMIQLTSTQLTVWCYNIKLSLIDSLSTQTTRLISWNTFRQSLLTNLIHQQLALFLHYPTVPNNFPSIQRNLSTQVQIHSIHSNPPSSCSSLGGRFSFKNLDLLAENLTPPSNKPTARPAQNPASNNNISANNPSNSVAANASSVVSRINPSQLPRDRLTRERFLRQQQQILTSKAAANKAKESTNIPLPSSSSDLSIDNDKEVAEEKLAHISIPSSDLLLLRRSFNLSLLALTPPPTHNYNTIKAILSHSIQSKYLNPLSDVLLSAVNHFKSVVKEELVREKRKTLLKQYSAEWNCLMQLLKQSALNGLAPSSSNIHLLNNLINESNLLHTNSAPILFNAVEKQSSAEHWAFFYQLYKSCAEEYCDYLIHQLKFQLIVKSFPSLAEASSNCLKSIEIYMCKLFQGHVVLAKIIFQHETLVSRLYDCSVLADLPQHLIKGNNIFSSQLSLQSLLNSSIATEIHLNSFNYDWNLRLISKQLNNLANTASFSNLSIIRPLNSLHAQYEHFPLYAVNRLIHEARFSVPLFIQVDSSELFHYIAEHASSYSLCSRKEEDFTVIYSVHPPQEHSQYSYLLILYQHKSPSAAPSLSNCLRMSYYIVALDEQQHFPAMQPSQGGFTIPPIIQANVIQSIEQATSHYQRDQVWRMIVSDLSSIDLAFSEADLEILRSLTYRRPLALLDSSLNELHLLGMNNFANSFWLDLFSYLIKAFPRRVKCFSLRHHRHLLLLSNHDPDCLIQIVVRINSAHTAAANNQLTNCLINLNTPSSVKFIACRRSLLSAVNEAELALVSEFVSSVAYFTFQSMIP
jgi:iron-sulfur cluster repair protein YtfE (RIC family)